MRKINFPYDITKIHFIGIGGISMSGLANILQINNYIVSGSDSSNSSILDDLKKIGIKIYKGHKEKNISDDIDLVVYTAAIKSDNKELIAAKNKNIKIIDRAELLGILMKSYDFSIAVAGTHGKTTTTCIMSQVLLDTFCDPTIMVGGFYPNINSNFRLGNSEYFVAESCEYFDSFLKFYPKIAIILNIDLDHLDYFKDIEHISNSFSRFAQNIDKDGFLIINNDIQNFEIITKNVSCKVITYGFENADYIAKNISYDNRGFPSFDIFFANFFVTSIQLNVVGNHNILNSLAVFVSSQILNLDAKFVKLGIENFCGCNRRFQFKGKFNDVEVIDDYAHHPTEIKATLSACKNMKKNKIWCVFQPHTYTRTKSLLDEFSSSFDDCDSIIILDIYSAREKDTKLIHAKDLVDKLRQYGKNAIYLENFESCISYLQQNCIPNDMLITMGAGDVYIVADELTK